MEAELPDDALVVAGRFPFTEWTPCRIEGDGVDRAWAYTMQAQRLPAGSAVLPVPKRVEITSLN